MENTNGTPAVDTKLAPVLPEGIDSTGVLDEATEDRFRANWTQLERMGFELEVRRNSLQVRHRDRKFETVIQLTQEDDLGERRALYQSLRVAFGRATDRYFSWMFQPSHSVTAPYESFKEIISICQAVRNKYRFSL